jgi:hypothetical protein
MGILNLASKIVDAWETASSGWNDAKAAEFRRGGLAKMELIMSEFDNASNNFNRSTDDTLSSLRAHPRFQAEDSDDQKNKLGRVYITNLQH